MIDTGSFLLKISKWNREKLQDSWQGNVSSNKRIRKLEIFIRECKVQVQDLDWPQKFRMFHKSTKFEEKISLLGTVPVKIQFYLKTYTRNKNGKSK